MFDDFKDSQMIAYQMIKNSVRLDKVSHAYLIDSNYTMNIDKFVLSFIKFLICPYHYSDRNHCENCNRCSRIENRNDPEVRHIYPDGLTIKKEQLQELQEEFNLSSIEGNRRIYVIWDCDKMNVQASNSILKFLEEPLQNIVAILVTSRISSMLPTIISRCQYIKLNQEHMYLGDTYSNALRLIQNCGIYDCNSKEIVDKYINGVIDFISFYEKNDYDILIYMKKFWNDIFVDRTCYIIGMQLIIQLYYDILKYKLRNEICFYLDYPEKIKSISDLLNIDDIIRKLNICIQYMEDIKYNLNLNLFMDSFIIELGE